MAGTIGAQTIILSGSSSILQSSNFSSGVSGWRIRGDGNAEFVGLTAQSLDAGSGNTSAHINTSGQLWVGNASYGSGPFRVNNNGDTVVANLTVTGTLTHQTTTENYGSGSTVTYSGGTNVNVGGNVTLTGGGVFRTASSGGRAEMTTGTVSHSGGGAKGVVRLYGAGGGGTTLFGGDGQMGLYAGTGSFNNGISVHGAGGSIFDSTGSSIALNAGTATIGAGTIDLNSAIVDVGNNIRITGDNSNPEIKAESGNLRLFAGGASIIEARSSALYCKVGTTTSTSNPMRFQNSTGAMGALFVITSSERFKKDIVPLTGGMDLIRELTPIEFTSLMDEDADAGRIWSFSAENAAAAHPKFAGYENDGTTPRNIDQGAINAQMVVAMKELDARIAALEAA